MSVTSRRRTVNVCIVSDMFPESPDVEVEIRDLTRAAGDDPAQTRLLLLFLRKRGNADEGDVTRAFHTMRDNFSDFYNRLRIAMQGAPCNPQALPSLDGTQPWLSTLGAQLDHQFVTLGPVCHPIRLIVNNNTVTEARMAPDTIIHARPGA
jgi:hypothetical protein